MAKIRIEVFDIILEKPINDKYAYRLYKELTTPQTAKEEALDKD